MSRGEYRVMLCRSLPRGDATVQRFLAAGLALVLVASRCPAEDVLFEDTFKDGLSKKWEVVVLDKKDYRIKDGGRAARPPRRSAV